MLQTSQQYRIQRTQGSQQPYIARVLYQISRKPRSVHLTVSWSKHHRFQAEFSPARCGFIADNGVCVRRNRSRVGGGRLFSLKVIIRRVKTSMRPGQANIFKPPLCAKRFSFSPSPSPPPSPLPLLPLRFIFLSVALPPLAAAHNYREWLCELVVSTGITYPHEITIRHFAGADPA